jgi:hypothetical protein
MAACLFDRFEIYRSLFQSFGASNGRWADFVLTDLNN